jgi:hypothetical protein
MEADGINPHVLEAELMSMAHQTTALRARCDAAMWRRLPFGGWERQRAMAFIKWKSECSRSSLKISN